MGTSLNKFEDEAMKVSHTLFDSIEKPLEETYNQIKTKTVDAYDSSIQMVRQNPVKSLAVALGIGVAAGYLLRHR
jgi:ElaB/YqjD/DUF883 family membrane-anchored ribosome-binding protein